MLSVLPSSSYKGTRDFYPDDSILDTYDFRKQNYIFETWKKTLTKRGFVQYDSSIIENAQIYIEKSGEELGSTQLYSFLDKGGRLVALRPEMTPSLARLVANKFRELKFPLRWFSIPNCFRYERPQKGRLREHWQLNVDIIGLLAGEVELELLILLGDLFKDFGADKRHFKIMYNHRQVLDNWLKSKNLFLQKELIYKVLDNWYKLDIKEKTEILSESLESSEIQTVLNLGNHEPQAFLEYQKIAKDFREFDFLKNLDKLQPDLEYEFSPTIIRGIAYYTGLVLEAFDKNPQNSRALFGGGRYDNLLELFGKSAPAIGFGWGDVTMHEFLSGHNLYPNFNENLQKVGILAVSEESLIKIFKTIIPNLIQAGKIYEINYEYSRSENKRRQTLNKKGCKEIILV
jgi:histidyl-tRNA synthetase